MFRIVTILARYFGKLKGTDIQYLAKYLSSRFVDKLGSLCVLSDNKVKISSVYANKRLKSFNPFQLFDMNFLTHLRACSVYRGTECLFWRKLHLVSSRQARRLRQTRPKGLKQITEGKKHSTRRTHYACLTAFQPD